MKYLKASNSTVLAMYTNNRIAAVKVLKLGLVTFTYELEK